MTLRIDSQHVLASDSDDTLFRFDPNKHEVYRDGERVTAEMVKGFAASAERVGPPPGLIPGGKSLSGEGKHSPALRVVVPESLRDRIQATADREGVSVSKYVRQILDRHVPTSA